MAWVVVALVVTGLLTAVALVVQKRRIPEASSEIDPLFLVGIPLAGVGAALLATMGPPAVGLVGVGVVLMVIGAVRSRRRTG